MQLSMVLKEPGLPVLSKLPARSNLYKRIKMQIRSKTKRRLYSQGIFDISGKSCRVCAISGIQINLKFL